MTTHIHSLPDLDGPDADSDVCTFPDCEQILCPDTNTPVHYDAAGTGPTSYWHLDGSTCFLHQTSVPEGFQP